MHSALLGSCCVLEAGKIYTGTQPQAARFNFQGHLDIIQEFLTLPVVLRNKHNSYFDRSYSNNTYLYSSRPQIKKMIGVW